MAILFSNILLVMLIDVNNHIWGNFSDVLSKNICHEIFYVIYVYIYIYHNCYLNNQYLECLRALRHLDNFYPDTLLLLIIQIILHLLKYSNHKISKCCLIHVNFKIYINR